MGNISNPIQRAESIVVLKLIDKKTISNADKTKIEQLKNSIIKNNNCILYLISISLINIKLMRL